MPQVVIIGAGVGGLTAAIRLAHRGCRVTVIESRNQPGGLAARLEIEGFRFDAGPYILLDRPGLEWACRQIGMDAEPLSLQRVSDVYETEVDGQLIRVSASLDETAAGFEGRWPGSGRLYRRFIADMQTRYARLQPLQCAAPPRLGGLLRSGAWRDIPFLLRSLGSVLAGSRLPEPLAAALGIWTHVAGQTMAKAPSALALVPAVIHRVGAFYPREGIGAIPDALFGAAQALGIDFRLGTKVRLIRTRGRAATGVELSDGEFLPAEAVISNVGLGTYRRLLDEEGLHAIPARSRRMLDDLPLQSPGVCAYLAVKGPVEPPYLRFRIRNEPDGCRLLVTPAVLDPTPARGGWQPARLIAPLNHERAESGGEQQQREFLARVLAEDWWQKCFTKHRVLATRIPQEWGSAYHLYQNSMNPVMTAEFMRAGRLAHRSPWIRKLYLTGSGTHPGQWVSFCMVSGVLTADRVLDDGKG
ncbi:MAG TPA: NAD(P)/FAD-dependent oxidoreductase [Planctomycetaceae bacterium]|nr:NAD(P)/FAD-dependent oxidoreductase [Planctomycetaceae bacterium]